MNGAALLDLRATTHAVGERGTRGVFEGEFGTHGLGMEPVTV